MGDKMRHGSLFSGIGGFDLAAEWMGWENIFHCEINAFGQKILKHYWPEAISYEDITKTDFTIHRGSIDIISGGFPCQPYSLAGKRKGKEDDRHLWPEMLRAIREVQPRWVVGENVLGLVNWNGGLVFHEVQTDLETQGYEVQPYVLPAAAVNAPHRRDRVWFVAKNSNKDGWRSEQRKEESNKWQQRNTCSRDNEQLSSDDAETWNATNSNSNGQHQCDCYNEVNPSEGRINAQCNSQQSNGNAMLPTPAACDWKGAYRPESMTNKDGTFKREERLVNIYIKTGMEYNSKTSQLNPRFVAEMMGFPPNWTELPFLSGETKV